MQIHLILEGHLEEPVAEKLLAYCGHEKGIVRGFQGVGYIQAKAAMFHPLATDNAGVLVLTDFMDSRAPCLPHALDRYILQHIAKPPKTFLCRFAVAELESWLMADRKGMAEFLKISVAKIPSNPDALPDPKRHLVNLARKSRKTSVREGIVPEKSHGGIVAPDYVATMRGFVCDYWNLENAITNSPSLARCVYRLQQLPS